MILYDMMSCEMSRVHACVCCGKHRKSMFDSPKMIMCVSIAMCCVENSENILNLNILCNIWKKH